MVKVLIADDHLVTRKFLQATLSKSGYEVIAVENGQQAWQALNQESDVRLAILPHHFHPVGALHALIDINC